MRRRAVWGLLLGVIAGCGGAVSQTPTGDDAGPAPSATTAPTTEPSGPRPDATAPPGDATLPPTDATPPGDASGADATPSDGGPAPDAADAADAADTGRDAASRCVSGPVEGAACAATDVACAAVDPCCFAFRFQCTGGRWTKVPHGILCLLCNRTPCGSSPCPGDQYCVERLPGIPGGTPSYSCHPYPTRCSDDWTCGCVVPSVAGCTAPTCKEDPRNHVRVSCQGI